MYFLLLLLIGKFKKMVGGQDKTFHLDPNFTLYAWNRSFCPWNTFDLPEWFNQHHLLYSSGCSLNFLKQLFRWHKGAAGGRGNWQKYSVPQELCSGNVLAHWEQNTLKYPLRCYVMPSSDMLSAVTLMRGRNLFRTGESFTRGTRK